MKILIAQFGNETNSFSPGRTTWETLAPAGWIKAEDVIPTFRNTATYVGGALKAIEEEGEEALPIDLSTRGGNFGAGPTMAAECANYAMDHICAQAKEHLGEFDGVFFAVHGAGIAENTPDLEAWSFKRLREVTGDIPMMSSLDAHANVSADMVALSDGLFGIKTIPHMDCAEAGYAAAKNLIRKLRGKSDPKMALRKFPRLIAPAVGCTFDTPGREILEYTQKYREEHGLLDVTFYYGFAESDTPCSSCSILAVADGRVPDKEADELAERIWEMSRDFKCESLSPAEALDRAESLVRGGYVVINEASDNPGGGCPGDGTHLLREMIKRDGKGYIMGPLCDPEAVAYIFEHHKPGDRISIAVGGKTDPVNGEPVELKDALVLNLSNGEFVSASPINRGVRMSYGKTARLRQGNVELILVSDRFQTYDDRSFIAAGCDMSTYRIVGLKSMNHFKGYFRDTADAIVCADPPGQCPMDIRLHDYKNVRRPIIPLDGDVEY
ncbi:MAG: M81 family metallopeptidase [Firmicutes bacterium]|nr:M81 family metallopeptidase [Bacillota bacterium]